MNADWYISYILRLVILACLRSLPNVTFQQDIARPHVASRVLIFFVTQGIRLLPWPAWSADLSTTEKIWSWVSDRLVHHSFSANKIDEGWIILEVA